MKRLYTFSPLQQDAGIMPLQLTTAAAASLPWANASFAQQSLFSFSQRSNIL